MITLANQLPLEAPRQSSQANECILRVLAYFDIFQYPLTKEEIVRFIGRTGSAERLDGVLQQLLSDQVIYFHNGFYSLHNNILLAHRRKEGNSRAGSILPTAYRIGRFLYRFPFVRAVCISGSLSKNFADDKADIDFFIITRSNRLWMARTIMHLFKKLTFLTGHQHYFCMNYFIDEEALLISDQNIYTALEITTLMPVAGAKTMKNFFSTNNWVARFFPAADYENRENSQPDSSWFRNKVESIFPGRLTDRLDDWLLKLTTRRWQRKAEKGRRNKNGYAMQLITGKHFSRSNPGAFQERVLALYEQKLNELKIMND
jgi:hypothetical protein